MVILATQNPTFQPAMRIITAITQSNPVVITTSFDHNYGTGEIVRINIAPGAGMTQINQKSGALVVISPTEFALPINSTNFDAFVVPPINTPDKFNTSSQVTPIGEVNSTLLFATRNVLRTPR